MSTKSENHGPKLWHHIPCRALSKTLKLKWHFQPCPLTTLHLRRLAVSVPGRKVTSHGSPKGLQQSDTDTVKTSCIAGTPRSLRIRRDSRVAGVALFRASDLRVYESSKESRCQDKHGYEGVGISIVDFGHLGYCIYIGLQGGRRVN